MRTIRGEYFIKMKNFTKYHQWPVFLFYLTGPTN